MAAKLTGGVVLAHPETGVPTFLAEGAELPGWAEGLVGEHLLSEPQGDPDGELKGKALDDALKAAELPTSGTADEKRARLAAHQESTPAGSEPQGDPDGDN